MLARNNGNPLLTSTVASPNSALTSLTTLNSVERSFHISYSTDGGESGTLLSIFGSNLNNQFVGITGANAFTSITITGNTSDNGFIDNVHYTSTPVPGPASVLILIVGMGLLRFAKRC